MWHHFVQRDFPNICLSEDRGSPNPTVHANFSYVKTWGMPIFSDCPKYYTYVVLVILLANVQ